ncbi:MAG: SRPBCC domain-containing protein [Bacteroidia bacterium]|jgi:uncharacterized protein YndB with AHSA1/START domain|nr:SRPBCC domain-containing protein [Bacteroidia bacterium]
MKTAPKTQVHAEPGKQEIIITREFDLPVELLFKAFTEAEFVAQWMSTNVVKLESRTHGSWRFETTDPKGNIHGFNGVIHTLETPNKITRTFEMEHTPFPPQMEFLEFEPITGETSRLRMQIIYKSVEVRDNMLKLPFAAGINMAHNRLEEIMKK